MIFTDSIDFTRFLDAQNQLYLRALSEIKSGRKQSHWMWFIFPQLKGLGHSETASFYALKRIEDAELYLAHPVLGKHLIEISQALLEWTSDDAHAIFSSPDDLKLRSSMTLFANTRNADAVFDKVIDKYFNGLHDERTLQLLIKDKLHDTV
ncbi:MAG TPA: DUF1810 domain-containing protein [Flavobacterium sp.]|nr:DUF1810 domain-containing protein [Flavobacterium sp.]HPJ09849.1 DUF1810 domain-containing protein [Flavobacterium sp.]